jgi:hypothetical protein
MSPDPATDAPDEEMPDMAFSLYARTFAAVYAMWREPTDDDANLSWLPSAMAQFENASTGHYIAEANLAAEPTRARDSFTDDTWSRLETLRRQIDPGGLIASFLTPVPGVAGTHDRTVGAAPTP